MKELNEIFIVAWIVFGLYICELCSQKTPRGTLPVNCIEYIFTEEKSGRTQHFYNLFVP